MASKDLITERLNQMNKSKETLKKDKPNVVESIATGKEEKPDFMKMAEALEAQKGEKVSLLDNAVKDTIYIRKDLYSAMQSLCQKQGDKRKHVNAAYEMYLTHIYNQRKNELKIDK